MKSIYICMEWLVSHLESLANSAGFTLEIQVLFRLKMHLFFLIFIWFNTIYLAFKCAQTRKILFSGSLIRTIFPKVAGKWPTYAISSSANKYIYMFFYKHGVIFNSILNHAYFFLKPNLLPCLVHAYFFSNLT